MNAIAVRRLTLLCSIAAVAAALAPSAPTLARQSTDGSSAIQNGRAGVASTLFVAVADDNNDDGVFNDAPAVIPDADGDGLCTKSDLSAFGVASYIEQVSFFINGPVDLSGLPQVP
jgi:hypothetical protein